MVQRRPKPRLVAPPPAVDPLERLRPESRELVLEVRARFDLQGHHERLLLLAATALDVSADARETLAREGLIVYDRWGQARAHPAVDIERKAANNFRLLCRELNLDLPGPDRPPRLGGS